MSSTNTMIGTMQELIAQVQQLEAAKAEAEARAAAAEERRQEWFEKYQLLGDGVFRAGRALGLTLMQNTDPEKRVVRKEMEELVEACSSSSTLSEVRDLRWGIRVALIMLGHGCSADSSAELVTLLHQACGDFKGSPRVPQSVDGSSSPETPSEKFRALVVTRREQNVLDRLVACIETNTNYFGAFTDEQQARAAAAVLSKHGCLTSVWKSVRGDIWEVRAVVKDVLKE